ncbi:MAG: hypothetical protein Kow0069_35000 [Promethearchaeota archaeon]
MSTPETLNDLEKAIDSDLFGVPAVKGVGIGTHGGTMLLTRFKKAEEIKDDPKHLVAATTSLLFLASKLAQQVFMQEIRDTRSYGEKEILVCMLTHNLTFSFLLNREIVELEGLNQTVIPRLKEFAMKASAIVETSDYIEKDIFVKIKRAIPDATVLAIISNSGMPIKIQAEMSEPKLSAIISALQNITNLIFGEEGSTEYTLLSGESGTFIILKIDEKRLLGVAVPEGDDSKLGKILARIKEIVENQ